MLKLCLASIAKHSEVAHEVVVHVNEGGDGTLDYVKRLGLPHTWTRQNVGICRAMNLAAARSRGEYLVYLNDDMYVLPGWDQHLYRRLAECGSREPCYVSGTMIQASPISPKAVKADYGANVQSFDEARLLDDHRTGRLHCSDWSGATWPPCGIHRKWWDLVGGYSEELFPGFYSDIDFSMKLWRIGCRRFWGIGSSLAYHFGERTTSLVRGPKKSNVKSARMVFLKKWGILPSTFWRHYLRAGSPPQAILSEPAWLGPVLWEKLRGSLVSVSSPVPEFLFSVQQPRSMTISPAAIDPQ